MEKISNVSLLFSKSSLDFVITYVLMNVFFLKNIVSNILLALDVFKMDALCDYTLAKTGKSLQDLINKSHFNTSFR